VGSRDFEIIAASESERDLSWFFDAYLRTAELPRLDASFKDGRVRLAWVSPRGEPVPMPIEVRIGEAVNRLDMAGGTATVALPAGATMQIDPDGWVLRAPQDPSGGRR
jgi:aminopeptidase N